MKKLIIILPVLFSMICFAQKDTIPLTQGTYILQLKLVGVGIDTSIALAEVTLPSLSNNGLNYNYYEGSYSTVPNFSTLTSIKSGTSPTFDISLANRADQFAFNFTGVINITTAGQYTFYTTSDDGSNLYIDGVRVVNNDGLHSAQEKSGVINLTAGKHAISVGFFEQTGDQVLTVSYSATGIPKQVIPSTALFKNFK